MSEEKKETKEALLGELESIKELLSEEEWDDIPILNDAIEEMAPAENPAPAESPAPAVENPSNRSDIDAAVDKFHFNLDLDSEDEKPDQSTDTQLSPSPGTLAAVPERPAPLQHESAVSPLTEETPLSAHPEDTVPDRQATPESSTTEAIAPQPPSPEPTDATGVESELDEEPLNGLSHAEPPETEPQNTERGAETAPREALPDETTALAPGVLPGQQSLFEADHKPAAADRAAPRSTEQGTAEPTHRREPVKSRGENPFLPQHIRDRLHTHKTLVDIIKESPVAGAAPYRAPLVRQPEPASVQNAPPAPDGEDIQNIVDELVASYLPKIEAELRDKLALMLARQASEHPSDTQDSD